MGLKTTRRSQGGEVKTLRTGGVGGGGAIGFGKDSQSRWPFNKCLER